MSGDGHVDVEHRDAVAWLILDRADRMNALAGQMRQQIREAVTEAARDPDVKSIVVTGRGEAFCAGGDVDAMAELRERGDIADFHELLHAGAEVVLALQAFPGLTVAAVNGVAAGAGLALALACDLRIATDEARLGATWSRLGLVPDWGATFWLPRLLGMSRALELVLSGRMVQAEEAERMGLVHRVVEPGRLREVVQETATRVGPSPEMVQETRRLLRAGLEGSLEAALAREAEAQEDRFLSEEAAEGFAAFREKRPPRFDGS